MTKQQIEESLKTSDTKRYVNNKGQVQKQDKAIADGDSFERTED